MTIFLIVLTLTSSIVARRDSEKHFYVPFLIGLKLQESFCYWLQRFELI